MRRYFICVFGFRVSDNLDYKTLWLYGKPVSFVKPLLKTNEMHNRRDMNICIFIWILLFSRLLCCEPAVRQSASPAAAQGPEVGPEPGGGDDDGPVAGGAPPQLQRLLGPDPPPGAPGAGS